MGAAEDGTEVWLCRRLRCRAARRTLEACILHSCKARVANVAGEGDRWWDEVHPWRSVVKQVLEVCKLTMAKVVMSDFNPKRRQNGIEEIPQGT